MRPVLRARADYIRQRGKAQAFHDRCRALAELLHSLAPYMLVIVGAIILLTSNGETSTNHSAVGWLMTGGGGGVFGLQRLGTRHDGFDRQHWEP
jgi:pantothenate kinase